MTIAEITRAVESKQRVIRREQQEKASFDYVHAGLIGRYVARILDGKGDIPSIYEVYPEYFEDIKAKQEEELQQKQDELSALRFRQFAQSYNKNFEDKNVKE